MTTRQYDKSERVELADEAVHWDLGSSVSYGEYLQLDKLLAAQKPLSSEHNEMLFIIVHQVSELWMRLMLHELTAALECVRRDDLDPALKMLARISRTQTQLISVWDVLSTMTPFEYSAFRNALGRSSGFQSLQYRMLEFLFGNKNAEMVAVHQRDALAHETLQRALAAPSLYDEVLRLLSRRGYGIPQDYLSRDFSAPYQALPSPENRRAHHRLQARHRRHRRRFLSRQGAGAQVLSGAVADPDLDVTAAGAGVARSPRGALRARQRTRRYANSSARIPM